MQNRRFAGPLTCDPGCRCPVKHVTPSWDRRGKCVRPSAIGGPGGLPPPPPARFEDPRRRKNKSATLPGTDHASRSKKSYGLLVPAHCLARASGVQLGGVFFFFSFSVPCNQHNTQCFWHPASIMWSPGDAKGAGKKQPVSATGKSREAGMQTFLSTAVLGSLV